MKSVTSIRILISGFRSWWILLIYPKWQLHQRVVLWHILWSHRKSNVLLPNFKYDIITHFTSYKIKKFWNQKFQKNISLFLPLPEVPRVDWACVVNALARAVLNSKSQAGITKCRLLSLLVDIQNPKAMESGLVTTMQFSFVFQSWICKRQNWKKWRSNCTGFARPAIRHDVTFPA